MPSYSGVWNLPAVMQAVAAGNWQYPWPAQIGVFFGGYSTARIDTIQYINIASTGNATDFGDLSTSTELAGSTGSSTRGIAAGGTANVVGFVSTISYVSFASTGNASAFGDLTIAREGPGGMSNGTRGVFANGSTGSPSTSQTIDYITIASIGNAIDFGDAVIERSSAGACQSTTRGVFGCGYTGTALFNSTDYITLASTGNASSFGNLIAGSNAIWNSTACSNSTRGLFSTFVDGGTGVVLNNIVYITIATTGNSTDFGDLTVARSQGGSCSGGDIGVFAGGRPYSGSRFNVIDYVNITSTGNATDFGDMTSIVSGAGGCSNAHGGLS
jgi:hypothetical protein